MTYDEALAVIKARYDAGEREIEVSADVYEGYVDGLTMLVREGGRPNQDKEWVAFKLARVYRIPEAPALSNDGVRCPTCQHELQVGEWPFCPHGRGIYGVQDDSIPGGLEIKNGKGMINEDGSPKKYYSRTEINKAAKAAGLENHVVHVGTKGGDRSPHTVRWI